MDAKPKPRRFRFSLRTLLVIVTIGGIPFAWLGYVVRVKQRERATIQMILRSGGEIMYDYEIVTGDYNPQVTPPGPTWVRKLLGEDFFAHVDRVWMMSPVSNGELLCLGSFPQLRRLSIDDRQLAVAEVMRLCELPHLEEFYLKNSPVTDQEYEQLKRVFPKLKITRWPIEQ